MKTENIFQNFKNFINSVVVCIRWYTHYVEFRKPSYHKELHALHPLACILPYTEKMNRVHFVRFQHDNPCSVGNFLTRLTVSTLLLLLILFSFNTYSHVNRHKCVDAFRGHDRRVNCTDWRTSCFIYWVIE